jgi:putative hydrolase of the HAD superfamily
VTEALQGLLLDYAGVLTTADGRPHDRMRALVAHARRSGLRTALISNGVGPEYDRDGWAELFDVTVVSGEVGMRKPDADIYLLCARRLGVPPHRCVFVDDLMLNVRGAVAAGMVGLRHRSYDETAAELRVLFGRDLAP